MRNKIQSLLPLFVVVLISLVTILPLFNKGFFPMHDDTQPARVYEMAMALREGQFPVRWVGDLGYGYGYPLFNFYAPLPYYVGALFHLLGKTAIDAAKIMMGIGMLLAAVTMYLFVASVIGTWGGTVAAIAYAFVPYHAVQLYVRGSVGELWAYGFLPFIGLGITQIVYSKFKKRGYFILSIGYVIVILSHNILGALVVAISLIFIIVYFLYCVLMQKKINKLLFLSLAFVTGVGLSAFFTLPAILESGYTRVNTLQEGGSNFRNHFVYFDQLWDSPWGFAGSAPGRSDGMSFKLGKLIVVLGLVSTILIFKHKKAFTRFQRLVFGFLLTLLVLAVFFMLETSRFLWEVIPGSGFIQYPWRFLTIAMFSISFIASYIVVPFGRRVRRIVAVGVITSIIVTNMKYFVPQTIVEVDDNGYTAPSLLRWKISRISDEFLPPEFIVPKTDEQIEFQPIRWSEAIYAIDGSVKFTYFRYTIDAQQEQKLFTNVAYFPGWRVFQDGKEIPIERYNGKIAFIVNKGVSSIIMKLSNTPVRTVANTISIFSIVLLVYVTLRLKKT